MTIQQGFELAVQHHQSGRLAEAEAIYRQILTVEPRHADALHLLGVIALQVGRNEAAVDLIRQAIAIKPNYPESHSNLGNALREQGQLDEAVTAYRQAVALKPDYAEAHNNLGTALRDQDHLNQAVTAYRQAVALKPDYAEAHNNLGIALRHQDQLDEAIDACDVAIRLRPDYAEAHCNRGVALHDQRRFDEAVAAYRQALRLKPSLAQARSNLGTTCKDTGRLDEAIASYRSAMALAPRDSSIHSTLIYALHFHPGHDAVSIHEEHDRWQRQHAEPLRQFIRPHSNDRTPDRRLRIGYVSPDFRAHCQSLFTTPLLSQHDHRNFEVFCYASVQRPDAVTAHLQCHADTWRNTAGLTDEQLAAQVREDQIDVLVDLTLHMADNLLFVFARKPAPVQVTWLGYPGSTGLSTIDYRLSDPYLDPASMDESIYSEETVRLPHSFWCYDPLDCGDLTVNPLPAQSNGFITFGCLNNFCKINDAVLRLWARVLRAVPSSRLLLLAPEGSHRQHTLDVLGQEGVVDERIEFVTHQLRRKYLELYHRIDLGLDTLPYNGHTTSLDSFWMGVPVATLVGQTIVGRAGLSQSMNLQLPELIAHTPEQYVQVAVGLTKDLPRLSELRGTLRVRMEQSPLMDAPRFARDVEAAYRKMWRHWCLENKPALP